MGGGSPKAPAQPEPPKPPSTQEQMESWAKGYPAVAEAQMEYMPIFARETKALQEEFYPTTAALQENIAGQATRGMEQSLSDTEKDFYRDQFSSGLGTNAGSPMGSDYMSRNMLMAQQGREDYWRNVGSTMAGRQPLSQAPSIGQFQGGFTPGAGLQNSAQMFGSQANIFGSQAGMFNQSQASATAERGQSMNFMSDMIGGGMGMIGGMI